MDRFGSGEGWTDIRSDFRFDGDSVVQLHNLCQGLKRNLAPGNVFQVELLCDERKAAQRFATEFKSAFSIARRRNSRGRETARSSEMATGH
jgi:hypothetical protein